MVAEGGAVGGALIPPRAGAQVNEAYTTFNVVHNQALGTRLHCTAQYSRQSLNVQTKSAIGSRNTHIVY